ncbi:energy transducer TonB [Aeoliella mucimassa]|uniref:Transport protein TonB n=1 Tax=Aeoliella mucimassa TaxID=2527972 RepID=A0A518AU93_9BACT|nr:energy transducer TonB [Aeoliella mucimassa]QDU58276.1 transport protein TonB [Aeoliella mucimassa]
MLTLIAENSTVEAPPAYEAPLSSPLSDTSSDEIDLPQFESQPHASQANQTQWSAAWCASVCLHLLALAAVWVAFPASRVERVTLSGERFVLAAQFTEQLPTPELEAPMVEVEIEPDLLVEPTELVTDPEPIPEWEIELPAEAVVSPAEPPATPTPPGAVVESSTPTPASVSSEPASVGLDDQVPAKLLTSAVPQYPQEAAQSGWSGRVTLRLHIAADGSVSLVDVVDSSGHELLDKSAIDAVQQWTFHPAQRDGEPVESTAILPVSFLPK